MQERGILKREAIEGYLNLLEPASGGAVMFFKFAPPNQDLLQKYQPFRLGEIRGFQSVKIDSA